MRAALLFALLLPTAAHAHPVVEGVGGVYGGLLHPLMVPAHLMGLVALGLLAAQQQEPHTRALLALLSVSFIGGLVAVVTAFAPTGQDLAILIISALAGVLATMGQRLPLMITAPLMMAGGAAIELDSVPQEISRVTTFLALIGTAVGGSAIAVLVAELARRMHAHWQYIALRVLAAWIAAVAILVLALRLAR